MLIPYLLTLGRTKPSIFLLILCITIMSSKFPDEVVFNYYNVVIEKVGFFNF